MFNNIPPLTRNIIIINVVVFIVVTLLNSNQVNAYLAAFYPFSPFFSLLANNHTYVYAWKFYAYFI